MPNKRKSQIILPEEAYEDSVPRSLYGNRSLEQVPIYDPCGGEKVYGEEVNSNCFIVLGNDRTTSKASGKGGQGFTQCGKIDLIAGLNSVTDPSSGKTNPNPFNDAARIYLSQKTNVDKNFAITQGTETVTSNNHSAVALKADHVRVIARNHIKLVTGAPRTSAKAKDSKGEELIAAGKIDFLAGNTSDSNMIMDTVGPIQIKALQPLIKGDNLEKMLFEIINIMSDIQEQVFANKKAILELAASYQRHVHFQGFPTGVPNLPSPESIGIAACIAACFTELPSAFTIETNLASLSENYLNENFPLYIKSKNVNTT